MSKQKVTWSTAVGLALSWLCFATAAQDTLTDENVLIVYNSAVDEASGGGGQEIYNFYRGLFQRDGVLGLDLNDPNLLPGNITYANFITQIRNPIRQFLINNDLTEQVLVITLTRGIPTRIADLSENSVGRLSANLLGDQPTNALDAFNANNATFASVDSELALLFQDLEQGENGGAFDSPADNYIRNPYFNSTDSIAGSDRSKVQNARSFLTQNNYQVLRSTTRPLFADPNSTNQLFLTCRLDGDSVQDVIYLISRAQNIYIDPATDGFIIDEFDPAAGGPEVGGLELDAGGLSATVRSLDAGGDFDQLVTDLNNAGFAQINSDEGAAFLIGDNGSIADTGALAVAGPVAAVFTFGGNASTQNQNGYLNTFIDSATGQTQFVRGAYFCSIESYNARAFGGLPQFGDQGSVAEFIAAGGTFGVGTVFEPLSLGVNEVDILIDRHLFESMTFVEAAFASIPFVSGQSILIGDPLAKVKLGPRPDPIAFTVELAPVIAFDTEPGVHYTVYRSSDGKTFTPFKTIVGTGEPARVADTDELASSRLYRVQAQ